MDQGENLKYWRLYLLLRAKASYIYSINNFFPAMKLYTFLIIQNQEIKWRQEVLPHLYFHSY